MPGRIESKHRMTVMADQLTADDLTNFAFPLNSDTKINIRESIGQRDERTLIFEADIDVNKGRIF